MLCNAIVAYKCATSYASPFSLNLITVRLVLWLESEVLMRWAKKHFAVTYQYKYLRSEDLLTLF
jgi:hypothetical protein